MNKGFWHGIAGVAAVAVIGVAAWQFISLHERVHTLEDEMNVLLAQTQVINNRLAEMDASSDEPEESTSETVDMTGFQETLSGIGKMCIRDSPSSNPCRRCPPPSPAWR